MKRHSTLPQGREKPAQQDDPLELVGTHLPAGDPELMMTCIVEEYARMGLSGEEILRLFREPAYQTHQFYRQRGEKSVKRLINEVMSRTGRLVVSVGTPGFNREQGRDGDV